MLNIFKTKIKTNKTCFNILQSYSLGSILVFSVNNINRTYSSKVTDLKNKEDKVTFSKNRKNKEDKLTELKTEYSATDVNDIKANDRKTITINLKNSSYSKYTLKYKEGKRIVKKPKYTIIIKIGGGSLIEIVKINYKVLLKGGVNYVREYYVTKWFVSSFISIFLLIS
jgi:hypothetical protein